MRGLKYKLDRRSLETIYMSFIRPSIEYGDVLWAGTYDSDLCKLDIIQVDAMRIVTGATARSNINLLYVETGWPSLEQRRLSHVLKLMYKIVHQLAPPYLINLLPQTVGHHGNYALRNSTALRVPFTRTESFRRSFFPFALPKWNDLPAEVRDLPSLDLFSHATKPEHKRNALYYCGERLASLHHTRTRLGCSKLNSHLCHNLHVTNNAACQCGYENEDSLHYYLQCPLFTNERAKMNCVITQKGFLSLETILYGDPEQDLKTNIEIFQAVHQFILDTKRLTTN